jgi:hypothetical protein
MYNLMVLRTYLVLSGMFEFGQCVTCHLNMSTFDAKGRMKDAIFVSRNPIGFGETYGRRGWNALTTCYTFAPSNTNKNHY